MRQKRFVERHLRSLNVDCLQVVEQFQRESEPLQELLLKRAQTEENWVRRT